MKRALIEDSSAILSTPALVLLGASAVTAACHSLPAGNPAQDPRAAIARVVDAYEAAWNTHDASAVGAFYTHDADIAMGSGPTTVGRQADRKSVV